MHYRGFTVVELVIAISVIAILATLVTVGYNGVQARARNTKVADAVKTYIDVLELYRMDNATYPTSAGSNRVCLGTEYPGDVCWLGDVSENSTFMSQLQALYSGGTLPSSDVGAGGFRGIIFSPAAHGNRLDGVNTNFVAYVISNSMKCPVGPIATYVSGQDFNSTVPASGYSVAPNAAGNVQCWVPLK